MSESTDVHVWCSACRRWEVPRFLSKESEPLLLVRGSLHREAWTAVAKHSLGVSGKCVYCDASKLRCLLLLKGRLAAVLAGNADDATAAAIAAALTAAALTAARHSNTFE